MQKKNLFSFHFQVHVTSPSLMAKLLKSREQNKETRFFFCHQKDFDLGSHAFLHENHHQR